MAKRIRYTPEQIITKLREAEVYLIQGKTISQPKISEWTLTESKYIILLSDIRSGSWISKMDIARLSVLIPRSQILQT